MHTSCYLYNPTYIFSSFVYLLSLFELSSGLFLDAPSRYIPLILSVNFFLPPMSLSLSPPFSSLHSLLKVECGGGLTACIILWRS